MFIFSTAVHVHAAPAATMRWLYWAASVARCRHGLGAMRMYACQRSRQPSGFSFDISKIDASMSQLKTDLEA